MTGPGRRPGSPDTKGEILEAARAVFAEVGYTRATVRTIAERAGVDPGMLYHHFGTKDQLFAASIDLPMSPADLRLVLADAGPETGRRLAEVFFTIWEREESRVSLLGLLRSAIGGEEQAVVAFREFIGEQLQASLNQLIDAEDAPLRSVAMASHLVGLAMARYVVGIEPLASAPVGDIIDLVAPRLQSYVDP